MAIVGMAGLGKTTLAKSVYNEDAIDNYFQKKIWVCVSDNFQVSTILICILESLNPAKATVRESQDALIKHLQEELKETRYLLVLDDVWNENSEKWNNLITCLSKINSARGSKIVVTTRSAEVASITEKLLPRLNLKELSADDCWSILKARAFSSCSARIAPDLERIGRQIAEKCAGVPLMAKVLGSLMRSTPSIADWLSIKESRIWDLRDENDKIISVLKLSFNNLQSPYLKQCFAYCSLFPKDFVIERDDLIQLWMAQGFLQPSKKKSNLEMEDIGHKYFDILSESSLFQDATLDDYGIITTCKMHDLVHDLTEFVSKSESLMRDVHEIDDTLKIQHVAQVSTSMLERISERSARRLRSLSLNVGVPSNMLLGFKGLRVLKLYKANIEEFPISIGKMKHLRYLDISETRSLKILPKSIGKLYMLQTLRAIQCGLQEFPKEVQNLINLRHVYFDHTTKFPLGMGRLTHLRTLPYFSVGKEMGRGIEELAGLNELNGELIIYNLEHVSDGNEAKKAKLEEKRNLRHLKFVWSEDTEEESTNNNQEGSTTNEEDVLEGLQPHPNLESLKIKHYMGAKFPSWMMERPFLLNHLKKIRLRSCNKCDRVPMFGHLPELRDVVIDGMANLKCIGVEFYGSSFRDAATISKGLFPKLITLTIKSCNKLTEWMEAPVDSTDKVAVFPHLEDLCIQSCPKLSQAPSHFPSLKKLDISSIDSATPIESISRRLSTLTYLEIATIKELSCLPEGLLKRNKNLTSLEISSCDELTCIAADVFGCCPSLGSLVVSYCENLRYLPDGLDTLPMLEKLSVTDCPSLELIPITHGIASLRQLVIEDCEGLSGLPSGLLECAFLQVLTIEGCVNLTSIPILYGLVSLRELTISSCDGLSGSLGGFEYCASLQELDIQRCSNLTSISITRGMSLTSLQQLKIYLCKSLSSFPALECCPSLRRLDIGNCPKLSSISISSSPTGPEREVFTSLETLIIRNCDSLQSIPSLRSFPSLCQLEIAKCEKLQSLVNRLQFPVSIEHLKIRNFPNLQTLPSLRSLTGLKSLEIGSYWEELDSFPDFQVPPSQLERLVLFGWPKLKSLPQQIQQFPSLAHLRINYFDGVEAFPEWLGNLTSLTTLYILHCQNLKYLPSVKAMRSLSKLETLHIYECPHLQKRCTEWTKISHIPYITGIDD